MDLAPPRSPPPQDPGGNQARRNSRFSSLPSRSRDMSQDISSEEIKPNSWSGPAPGSGAEPPQPRARYNDRSRSLSWRREKNDSDDWSRVRTWGSEPIAAGERRRIEQQHENSGVKPKIARIEARTRLSKAKKGDDEPKSPGHHPEARGSADQPPLLPIADNQAPEAGSAPQPANDRHSAVLYDPPGTSPVVD